MNPSPFQLPVLDRIRIASPCEASWNDMQGDDRQRFCQRCHMNVYNLSEMTRGEAESFIRQREGRTCVRYYQRADGSVMTNDCPVGLAAVRRRIARAIAAASALFVGLLGGAAFGWGVSKSSPRLAPGSQAGWFGTKPALTGSVSIPVTGKMAVMGDLEASPPLQMGAVCIPSQAISGLEIDREGAKLAPPDASTGESLPVPQVDQP
jgi:hypothetical protein